MLHRGSEEPGVPNQMRRRYRPPTERHQISLQELLRGVREAPEKQLQRPSLPGVSGVGAILYYSGDISLARRKCVAIVGSRKVSDEGARRAIRLARELVAAGVVVVSGLAEGVDTAAHRGAIEAGGQTIAMIGTPLDKAYPAQNAGLQEEIYSKHLLMTPFAVDTKVYRSNFPARNKSMATISDATVIIEAGDNSGSLHQVVACTQLNRPVFIARAVVSDPDVSWPDRFLNVAPNIHVLDHTADILSTIS